MNTEFTSNPLSPTDLGLTYEAALHGVQSAIAYKITNNLNQAVTPKHLRVGIDMSKSDMAGLVNLLIARSLFTVEEYIEALRVSANEELHQHEEEIRKLTGFTVLSFR